MNPYKTVISVSERQVRRKTWIAFIIFFLFLSSAGILWKILNRQPSDNYAPVPVRKFLNFNQAFFGKIFDQRHLSKTFTKEAAIKNPRVNGLEGLRENIDASAWKLRVVRNTGDTLSISLDEIKALPKTEIIFDFKCIEGWSQVTHWGGVKFSDFAEKYHLNTQTTLKYAGLSTPDNGYYVGIDMPSMLHPQTLLCYEINDHPLPPEQGFPLRLIIPVKYGIKHLKRIGTLYFSNERPPDYWYERGYDYYSGL